MIVVFDRTLHVFDAAASIPAEFDASGAIIRGGPAAKPVAPWTPVEVESEAEAERILKHARGVRIPANAIADPSAWLRSNAAAIGESVPGRIGATVHAR